MKNLKDNYTVNLFDKGKLTINHFLYQQTKNKQEFPLYVQVIFNRKSTQVRSCISEKFTTLDQALDKHRKTIFAEKDLIENLVEGAANESSNVSLKGLGAEIQKFHQNTFVFFERELVKRLRREIVRYSDYFMYEIKPIDNNYDENYVEACKRFYGDNEIYDKLLPLFKMKKMILHVAEEIDKESSFKGTIFFWVYLGGMDYFAEKARTLNYDEKTIIEAVDAITAEVYHL
jgi:hypothetical protein